VSKALSATTNYNFLGLSRCLHFTWLGNSEIANRARHTEYRIEQNRGNTNKTRPKRSEPFASDVQRELSAGKKPDTRADAANEQRECGEKNREIEKPRERENGQENRLPNTQQTFSKKKVSIRQTRLNSGFFRGLVSLLTFVVPIISCLFPFPYK